MGLSCDVCIVAYLRSEIWLRYFAQNINRYAPPIENHTESYIDRVANTTHLLPDEQLSSMDGAVMTAVVAAMSEVENGVNADMTAVWQGWELFMADFNPK